MFLGIGRGVPSHMFKHLQGCSKCLCLCRGVPIHILNYLQGFLLFLHVGRGFPVHIHKYLLGFPHVSAPFAAAFALIF